MQFIVPRAIKLLEAVLPAASAPQHNMLASYLELVAGYSDVLNLTRFRGEERLVAELAQEGARLLWPEAPAGGCRAVDLGSGNGCPVIMLAVLCPAVQFHAVESSTRKAAFLNIVKAKLALPNLTVHPCRVEELAQTHLLQWDLVTSRAFAKPPALFGFAAQLVVPGGEVRGFCGPDPEEITAAAEAAGFTAAGWQAYRGETGQRHVYRFVRPKRIATRGGCGSV